MAHQQPQVIVLTAEEFDRLFAPFMSRDSHTAVLETCIRLARGLVPHLERVDRTLSRQQDPDTGEPGGLLTCQLLGVLDSLDQHVEQLKAVLRRKVTLGEATKPQPNRSTHPTSATPATPGRTSTTGRHQKCCTSSHIPNGIPAGYEEIAWDQEEDWYF